MLLFGYNQICWNWISDIYSNIKKVCFFFVVFLALNKTASTNYGLNFASRTVSLYQALPVVEIMLDLWHLSSGQFLQLSVIFETFDYLNITLSKHYYKEHQTESKAFQVYLDYLHFKYWTKQSLQTLSQSSVLDIPPNCFLILLNILPPAINVALFVETCTSFCTWIPSPSCCLNSEHEHHEHVSITVGIVKGDHCIAVKE